MITDGYYERSNLFLSYHREINVACIADETIGVQKQRCHAQFFEKLLTYWSISNKNYIKYLVKNKGLFFNDNLQ
jgi:hypothetical protein